MFKKKKKRLTREEERQLFALMDAIEKAGDPKGLTTIRHPARIVSTDDDELQDITDVQNRIKRLLGIDAG